MSDQEYWGIWHDKDKRWLYARGGEVVYYPHESLARAHLEAWRMSPRSRTPYDWRVRSFLIWHEEMIDIEASTLEDVARDNPLSCPEGTMVAALARHAKRQRESSVDIDGMRIQFGTLEIGPNDYLVFRCEHRLSYEQIKSLKEEIKEAMPDIQDRVVILTPGLGIGKITVAKI